MKTKRLLLALLFLVLVASAGYAQPDDSPAIDYEVALLRSPLGQEVAKLAIENRTRLFWDGHGISYIVATAMLHPEIRTAWGISDEQYQQHMEILVSHFSSAENRATEEELHEMMAEIIARQTPHDSHMADEEMMKRFIDIHKEMLSFEMIATADAMDNTLLTPEQERKIGESLLAAMGENLDLIPIVSPSMLEVLHLTDTQRQQMEQIKKALEPEFEKVLEEFVNGQLTLINMLIDAFDKQEEHTVMCDEVKQALVKKLMAESPAYKRISNEIQSSSMTFSTQFRTQMFDVLTDEQWTRLQELVDNPPPHARIFIAKLREQRGESQENEDDVWIPGPGSWRPGDPIPEAYRQQRNLDRRFPRPQ